MRCNFQPPNVLGTVYLYMYFRFNSAPQILISNIDKMYTIKMLVL